MRKRESPESSTPKPMRPERILQAAASLFAQKGYGATTTREIADASGLERASLYYHIDSKEEILYKICKATLEDGYRVIERVEGIADPLERLRRLITEHMTTILRNREANMTMLLEMRVLTGARRQEIVLMRDRYEERVRGFVSDAQSAGYVRTDQTPKILSIGLLNLLNWTLVWYLPDDGLSPDELGESFASTFLEGARIRTS